MAVLVALVFDCGQVIEVTAALPAITRHCQVNAAVVPVKVAVNATDDSSPSVTSACGAMSNC